MIDDSGFYVPPQREREYSNEGERILIRWMPGMPRENAYEGLPNDQGDIVIHVGEITGIVRRNDVVPTPKSRYHEEKRVADIELDMPELAWHKKIVTLWCDHEMLEDAMTWLEHEHGDGTLVTIKHLGMEKRRNLYGIRVHEDTASTPQAKKQAGGKPTTASGWTALWREKEAEGKSDAVLQRIIDTATADEFVWDGKEFISLLTDNAGAAPWDDELDDLPF